MSSILTAYNLLLYIDWPSYMEPKEPWPNFFINLYLLKNNFPIKISSSSSVGFDLEAILLIIIIFGICYFIYSILYF
jgi:hypothetical protein